MLPCYFFFRLALENIKAEMVLFFQEQFIFLQYGYSPFPMFASAVTL